jgi:spermidine/putrescine transport system substrate-binding protein
MAFLLRYVIAILAFCWLGIAFAEEKILNVFTWAGEIPYPVIAQFEKETGIKVNYSTFDSNEAMFAKLRASKQGTFDLVEPSSFYIDRMRHQNWLEKLDKSKLSNLKYIDPFFLNQSYDPDSRYSIPFIWGATAIFINKNYFLPDSLNRWADLFDKKYHNQLMLLDDSREVFSMALRMSGYSINDNNPEHIRQAYLKLKELMPNVRLFNNDAVLSILIDEDATVGMAWNGNLFRSQLENKQLSFIFPQEGFEIWVDNFALLKDAPHKENAYLFLNFLMRPEISKQVSLAINYSTANLAAQKLLPEVIRNNPALYPSKEVLRHGEFQADIGDKTIVLYEKYWQQLKMGV